MHARASLIACRLACLAWLAWSTVVAYADPKPTAVDVKKIRDRFVVLQDSEGGSYFVFPDHDEPKIFYGIGKAYYEQLIVGSSSDGTTGAWDYALLAPRIAHAEPGSIGRRGDGTFVRVCGTQPPANEAGLTQITGDKAKQLIDKGQFMTIAMIRVPVVLARDDHGVYYYVDRLRDRFGGKGYRLFVGKKGAMKSLALDDVASDSLGDVFSTKTGDLHLVANHNGDDSTRNEAVWVRGDKRMPLAVLPPDINGPLIYRELGVYSFIGTICENI
jgi:hypothetical protein